MLTLWRFFWDANIHKNRNIWETAHLKHITHRKNLVSFMLEFANLRTNRVFHKKKHVLNLPLFRDSCIFLNNFRMLPSISPRWNKIQKYYVKRNRWNTLYNQNILNITIFINLLAVTNETSCIRNNLNDFRSLNRIPIFPKLQRIYTPESQFLCVCYIAQFIVMSIFPRFKTAWRFFSRATKDDKMKMSDCWGNTE